MCEDRGMVIGGLIVAAAMLVWAFVGNHADASAPQHHAPRSDVATSITVSLDPMALELRHGRVVIELAV